MLAEVSLDRLIIPHELGETNAGYTCPNQHVKVSCDSKQDPLWRFNEFIIFPHDVDHPALVTWLAS